MRSVEYNAFYRAKARCENPKHHKYALYGGRGIEFRFQSFNEFFREVGKRPSRRYSIDRIRNEGHYEPGNVRWATLEQQLQNRRPYASPVAEEISKLAKQGMTGAEIARAMKQSGSYIYRVLRKRRLALIGAAALAITCFTVRGQDTGYSVKVTQINRTNGDVVARFVVVPQDLRIVCHGTKVEKVFEGDYVKIEVRNGSFAIKDTDAVCSQIAWIK